MPLGLLTSKGSVQYLHQLLVAIVLVPPPSLVLRQDLLTPTIEDFLSTAFFSVYVDSLDRGKAKKRGSSEPVETWFLTEKSACQRFRVVYHTGAKSQVHATDGKTLSGEIQTPEKTSLPLPDEHLTVMGESLWLKTELKDGNFRAELPGRNYDCNNFLVRVSQVGLRLVAFVIFVRSQTRKTPKAHTSGHLQCRPDGGWPWKPSDVERRVRTLAGPKACNSSSARVEATVMVPCPKSGCYDPDDGPETLQCQRSWRRVLDQRTRQWVVIQIGFGDDSTESDEESDDGDGDNDENSDEEDPEGWPPPEPPSEAGNPCPAHCNWCFGSLPLGQCCLPMGHAAGSHPWHVCDGMSLEFKGGSLAPSPRRE